MTAAASALIPSKTIVLRGRRRHQARSSKVGQMANPAPKLKEATNPAHTTITAVAHEQRILAIKRKASTAPFIVKEFSQLNSPFAVMLARPIQKLPMSKTSVDNVFAVTLMVLSSQIGIRSKQTVIKNSPSPAKKSVYTSP